jgi:hypothetical protein
VDDYEIRKSSHLGWLISASHPSTTLIVRPQDLLSQVSTAIVLVIFASFMDPADDRSTQSKKRKAAAAVVMIKR